MCFIGCSAFHNAVGIVEAVTQGLKTSGPENISIVAQSYDGTSVMSGQILGVQQRFKEVYPCVYIHCMAHK